MASFQAKICWGSPRKRENKKKSFRQVPTRPVIENSKKLENTILGSFRAKICWGRPRKRENKKNRSDEFLPDPKQKIPKKQQKKSKNKKTPLWLLFQSK